MNKDKIKLLVAFILMLALIFITGMSCNPVKRVLKNDKKFEIIAKEVIKRGYCVNDTVTLAMSFASSSCKVPRLAHH